MEPLINLIPAALSQSSASDDQSRDRKGATRVTMRKYRQSLPYGRGSDGRMVEG
ncbi:MAG: hypothetical protein FWD61_16630 [Phycisphaerales bacterium]|nr:hypothetical protein [Phycisphaerales bacterium]